MQNLLIAENSAETIIDSWEIDENITDNWDNSTPIQTLVWRLFLNLLCLLHLMKTIC